MNSIPTVNFTDARKALLIAAAADQPVLLLGDPGVGKTALAHLVARDRVRPIETLIGSTLDATDVAGLPVVHNGQVDRKLLAVLRRCVDTPSILFLDEISCAPLAVQASLLRLVLEKVAGDYALHPQTWIIAAANPPEQAPGGFELSAPFTNRVVLLHLQPTLDEVCDYFAKLGDGKLRDEAVDFSLTARRAPQLLQIAIPKEHVTGGRPWGSPRAWERALRLRAAASDAATSQLLTSGCVGEEIAVSYSAIVKLRDQLPSVDEIVMHPETAKLNKEPSVQIAALGVIARVAEKNAWAAWVYGSRLRTEFGAVVARHLMSVKHVDGIAHVAAGQKARSTLAKLLHEVTGALK